MAITNVKKYKDQRLTKKVKPVNQSGGPNYLGKQKTVTVPKKWLSDPDHVVAELAYITPREQKILLDADIYGSLKGKPNKGPAGIISLQGDMGSVGGGGGGNNNGGGGGGDNEANPGDRDTFNPETGGGGSGSNTGGGNGGNNNNYEDRIQRELREKKEREARQLKEKQRIEAEQAKKDKIAAQLAEKKRIEAEQAEKDKKAKQLADFKKRKEKELVEFQKKEQEKKDKIAKEAKIAFDLAEKKRIAKEAEDKKAKELSSLGIKNAFKGFFSNLPSVQIAKRLASMNKNPNRELFMEVLKSKDPVAYEEMVENLRGLGQDNEPNPGDMDTFNVETGKENNSGGLGMREDFVFGPPGDADLEFKDLAKVDELGGKFGFGEGYDDYMDKRMSGETDAYGNVNPDFGKGDGDNYVPPIVEAVKEEEEEVNPRDYTGLGARFLGSQFDFTGLADGGIARAGYMNGGMMEDTPEGGIMDLETGRQQYFLGKLVKKATRAIKKVAKSPFGKAALLYFGGNALMGGGAGKGLGSFFGKGSFNPLRMAARATADGPLTQLSPFGKILSKVGLTSGVDGGSLTKLGKFGLSAGIPAGLALLASSKEEEDQPLDLGPGIDIDAIRNSPYRYLAPRFTGSKYEFADGGRIGYAEGSKEPVAKETMPLLDMDNQEMDLRAEGGFVPIGRMERADDVPARLSKNEFVFTADAVRNAGEGDIDKGAEVMYNMMKNLESGGEVSEESQGLDGAREMFQTSQRLEEVL